MNSTQANSQWSAQVEDFLEPDTLVEVSNKVFRRYTAALALGQQEVGLPIDASKDDIERIRLSVGDMLDRIQIPSVVEETSRGIVVRRKTEAD